MQKTLEVYDNADESIMVDREELYGETGKYDIDFESVKALDDWLKKYKFKLVGYEKAH